MNTNEKSILQEKFCDYPRESIDLLARFLHWDPAKRITASEALLHPFFTSKPYPVAA